MRIMGGISTINYNRNVVAIAQFVAEHCSKAWSLAPAVHDIGVEVSLDMQNVISFILTRR